MEKILRQPNIWDLHIHTPLGTPSQTNYGGIDSEKFVEKVVNLYNEAEKKIGMISFTDHNKINAEVYKKFREKSDIAVIPGIEVDVYLTENAKDSKHVIFYFSEDELENIDELKELVETFIEENKKILFEDFILLLIDNKKRFAISPHAFKQRKRGLQEEWVDEKSAAKGKSQFTGLFFSFWEAAGKTEIVKAIDFLKENSEDKENTQAVIAFSDSSSFEKMKKYIDNPYQYFLCLNSFKGLLMAGSDISRIIYEYEERPNSYPSEKIKSITLSNNLNKVNEANKIEIELSDRLNVIIGGRGKGKSALLDAIVYAIQDEKIEDTNRRNFVKKFDVSIKNFNNAELASDINLSYFSQSYINALFDGNSQEKLDIYFKKEFSENTGISNSIADIRSIMDKEKEYEILDDINVMDDFKTLVRLEKDTVKMSIPRKSLKLIHMSSDSVGYGAAIKNLLPKNKAIWDESLENAFENFLRILLLNISKENYKNLMNIKFQSLMKNKYEMSERKKNKIAEKRYESKNRIEQKIRFLYSKELERIRQINKLYEVDENMTKVNMKYKSFPGESDHRFFFVSVANKEHPVEYARRMIVEATNKSKLKNIEKESFEKIFIRYALTNDIRENIKESVTYEELEEKIQSLKTLKAEKVQRIIYKSNLEYQDLHNTSPGTQTNAVMEFILHTDSTVPLFIDQPEDNIDNEARYSQLTKWIKKQKKDRQIILVSHDANIVINGDAECVIIADHTTDRFSYEYGALEYGNILDKAAVILDGGKTAIHRRIEKYGE